MKLILELNEVFGLVHNVNSDATKPVEFEFEERSGTWLDKYVLRWI